MTGVYKVAGTGALEQGELITGVIEFRPLDVVGGNEGGDNRDYEFVPVNHELTVVVTPACDLEFDYSERMADDFPE